MRGGQTRILFRDDTPPLATISASSEVQTPPPTKP